MNTPSMLDSIRQQLTPDTIQQMSQALGTDPGTTSKAISMALPMLLGGLTRNASTPQGAMALDQALGSHDGSILGDVGRMLNGGGGGIGAAILGHILGGHQAPVQDGVSKATGMNMQQVAQLLTMLAPLLMGVLGRMKQTHGVGANELPQVLNQSQAEMQSHSPSLGGLGQIFGGNPSGDIAGDIERIGSSILGGLFGQKS